MSNSRDPGSGAGALGVGSIQGVSSVTFPSTPATPPAPLPLELLVEWHVIPRWPNGNGAWLRTKRVQVRLLLGVRDDQ